MANFDYLLKAYPIEDLLDEIASADPPAYQRHCFAEGCAAAQLSFARALILDAVVDERDYAYGEKELSADWREHGACGKSTAAQALHRLLERDRPADDEAVEELKQLAARFAGA